MRPSNWHNASLVFWGVEMVIGWICSHDLPSDCSPCRIWDLRLVIGWIAYDRDVSFCHVPFVAASAWNPRGRKGRRHSNMWWPSFLLPGLGSYHLQEPTRTKTAPENFMWVYRSRCVHLYALKQSTSDQLCDHECLVHQYAEQYPVQGNNKITTRRKKCTLKQMPSSWSHKLNEAKRKKEFVF